MRRPRVRVLVALPCLGLVVACNDEPPNNDTTAPASKIESRWEEDAQEVAPLGETFRDADFFFEVGAPHRCTDDTPLGAKNGTVRLSFPVIVRARTSRTIVVGPLLFTAQDKEGHRFRPTLAGCGPAFATQELTEGKKIEAEVAFDVPSSLPQLEIHFEPFLVGRKKVIGRVVAPSERTQEQP